MTYEETIELEANVKIKEKAEKLYSRFLEMATLKPSTFENGRFTIWRDQYNAAYIRIDNDGAFVAEYRFLHESYTVKITPSSLFSLIKNKNRGVEHFESYVENLRP